MTPSAQGVAHGVRFPIRYDTFGRIVMPLALCFPSQSWVEIDGTTVRVRLAWAFRATFDAGNVESAAVGRNVVVTRGAHGWAGRWLVNAASGPIVAIRLRSRGRAWVAGFPVRLRELRVSIDDPEAFIAAVTSCRPTEGSARIS